MDDFGLEQRMLITAARHLITGGGDEALFKTDLTEISWDYVSNNAARHGLSPVLFKMLADTGLAETIPQKVLESLRHSFVSSLHNNAKLYKRLVEILPSFSDQNIPVIVLKGAALGVDIYPDIALRPFGDLDILVEKQHVPASQELLKENGFTLMRDIYFPIPDEKNDELGCEWSYVNGHEVIELHWNLIDLLAPFPINIEHFWSDAHSFKYDGANALSMSPESQLMHLCLHQYKHHWEHIRDLLDVALLIQKYENQLDWDKLCRRAREQGLERCVYYTLDLSHKILAAPVKNVPLEQILGKSQPGIISRGMLDMIASNAFEYHLPRRFWELALVNDARSRMKLLCRILAHPFPRETADHGSFSQEQQGKNRLIETLRSIYFYKGFLFKFMRNLFHPER